MRQAHRKRSILSVEASIEHTANSTVTAEEHTEHILAQVHFGKDEEIFEMKFK